VTPANCVFGRAWRDASSAVSFAANYFPHVVPDKRTLATRSVVQSERRSGTPARALRARRDSHRMEFGENSCPRSRATTPSSSNGSGPSPDVGIVGLICPVGQNTARLQNLVKSRQQKYSALPKFGFIVCVGHPRPPRGAIVRRHWSRAGLRWTRQRRARKVRAGRVVPVSPWPRADERR
jgi:hypothetical protein